MSRFYYIEAPGAKVVHMASKRMEGDSTWCGLSLKVGWRWHRGGRSKPRCIKCESHA